MPPPPQKKSIARKIFPPKNNYPNIMTIIISQKLKKVLVFTFLPPNFTPTFVREHTVFFRLGIGATPQAGSPRLLCLFHPFMRQIKRNIGEPFFFSVSCHGKADGVCVGICFVNGFEAF